MRAKLPTSSISAFLLPPRTHPPLAPSQLHHQVPTHSSFLTSPTGRALSTNPLLHKAKSHKGGKQESKRTVTANAAKAAGIDPFDFVGYDAAIAHAHEALKDELARIRAGGRDLEGIEGVRVALGKGNVSGKGEANGGLNGGGSGKEEVVRVRDVASVVARGRNVGVLVGEKEHLKPVHNALLMSSLNLSPTHSPGTDPLTITIPIPPTTAESRAGAKALASRKGEECLFQLREARGAQRKRHRSMELGRLVGPDDLRRALKEMETRNEGALAEVKKMVERCRKGLEG